MSSSLRLLVVLGFLLWVSPELASACPACEVGIGESEAKRALTGYLYSYTLLALCPFVIFGAIWRGIRAASMEDPPEGTVAALSP